MNEYVSKAIKLRRENIEHVLEQYTDVKDDPMSQTMKEHVDMKIKKLESELAGLNKPIGIPWRKYDPTDRSIESHVKHFITDGRNVWIACHAKQIRASGYTWFDDEREPVNLPVTHWSPINLPGEEEA